MQPVRIAVDAMGGDFGPNITVPAAIQCLSSDAHATLLIVGDQKQIAPYLQDIGAALSHRVEVLHSDIVIAMNDKPSSVLRNKSDSSMKLAIQAVKDGQADACVSAGNTGALMALSRSILGSCIGIDRPAMIAKIPTQKHHCQVLDLGANIQCNAHHLYQFAIMGTLVAQLVDKIPHPRVALLNVGQEEIKGNHLVKQAANLLAADTRINYVGFVEGDHIFSGDVDVVVCDGFVGNVALKTSEGLANMVNVLLTKAFHKNLYSKFVGVLAKPIFKQMVSTLDYRSHNGASLLGVQGTVIKSHGNADQASFQQAIYRAINEVTSLLPQSINDSMKDLQK